MPPSQLFHSPGFAAGGEVALGMSMAYIVLLSEATAMVLTSQGDLRSFLSATLPGVETVAHFSMAVSVT